MDVFLELLPLIVIMALLLWRVNMIVAGLAGGILAMIIGGLSIGYANDLFLETMPAILGIVVPIVNSAVAFAVFNAGGYTSALTLMKRGVGGRVELLAISIVVLQSAATYMSGIGGGTAVVIAPLAFAACGAIPQLVAGMSIAAAVAFTTSPASLETGIFSELTGVPVQEYVSLMRPYWLLFTVVAIVITYWGARKHGTLFLDSDGVRTEEDDDPTATLWRKTVPAAFLLFAVIAGPKINELVGQPVLGPFVYALVTVFLVVLMTDTGLNKGFESLVDGSSYILTRLFGVGIFLTFIFLVRDIGAFEHIANLTAVAPEWLMVPAAVLAGFLIGVPAGAYVGTILALILPVTISLEFSPLAMGLVVMGVGLGSQLSFVNITMQALSAGFQIPIERVVKGNLPYVLACLVGLIGLSFVVV